MTEYDPKRRWPHAMLDIESMSTNPGHAVILSCAIVPFALSSLEISSNLETFEFVLDIGGQLLMGRECLPSTQRWWADQGQRAVTPWLGVKGLTPSEFAAELAQWWPLHMANDACVWANGIAFDISNVESLILASGSAAKVPWKYNATRDARTVYKLTSAVDPTPEELAPYWGDEPAAHDPYFDCIYQIVKLGKAMESWPGAGGRVLVGPQGSTDYGV